MPHALVRRVSLAFAVLGSVVACNHDATSPKVLPEYRSYGLRSVGGAPLPYYAQATTAGDTVEVLAETVSLRTDGTATRSSLLRTVVAGGPSTTTPTSGAYVYHVSGSQITLTPQCGPGANCTAGDAGTISTSELSIKSLDSPDGPVYLYFRILPD